MPRLIKSYNLSMYSSHVNSTSMQLLKKNKYNHYYNFLLKKKIYIYISIWQGFVLGLELRFSHMCHVELGSWGRRRRRMEKNRSQDSRKYDGKNAEPGSETKPRIRRK